MTEKLEFQKKIGQRIAQLRTEKNITQSELARLCLKERQTIQKLEKGLFNPSSYYLYEIANSLGISIQEFFVGIN